MTQYTVSDYASMDGANLSDAGKRRVLTAFKQTDYDVIAHVPEWLAEDKELVNLKGARNLYPGTSIVAESEKGLCIDNADEEVWLPKSQIEWFRRGDDINPETPQRGIEDYAP